MSKHTDAIVKKKVHSDRLENLVVSGASEHGITYRVFSDVECRNVKIARSVNGFRFHNSDRPPGIKVDGKAYSLVLMHCDTEAVSGDGLYITKVTGALIENCRFDPPTEGSGDCCQVAFERKENNVSRDIGIRGCIMLQAAHGSKKGALILERTTNYSVEHCWFGGINFSVSSGGSGCVLRSNRLGDATMNGYSFGYGVPTPGHVSDHHVYDNVIENCQRGVSLSSFGDREVEEDGIAGYQRSDMAIHDNVIRECATGFFADRPWSGSVYRNIFVKCGEASVIRERGLQVARKGNDGVQIVGPIYTNDGSFRCEETAKLRIEKGVVTATAGRWSHEPDDLRYIWRVGGIDVPTPNMARFHLQKGQEVSCVVLARKGDNWMLCVAEQPWDDVAASGARFRPRAAAEGHIHWGSRYIRQG